MAQGPQHLKEKQMGSSHNRRLAGPVLIAAVAASGCLVALAEAPTAPAPPSVAPSSATTSPTTTPSTQPSPPTHLVKPGKLSFTVSGEGVFVADEPYELRLKLNRHQGELKIASIAANRAAVKKGETLLELDPFSINNDVTSAENELAAARAGLTKAEADADLGEKGDALAMRIQEQETKNAEAALRWWEKVDGPHMLEQTELQVKLAKANAEDQNDELDQLRKMYKSEDLTSATADIVVKRAVRQLEVAKLSSKMSEERAEKTENHSYPIARQAVLDSLEQSRQKLAMLKVTQAQAAVLRKTGLSAAKLALAQAEKKLADLKKDQEMFSVKAPADGVVMYGYASSGSWVGADPKTLKVGEKLTPGQTVLTRFKPGDLKVELTLPESQSAWVKDGAKADVKPLAYPELNYEGKAAEPAVKPGSTGIAFYTTVALADVDPRVVPGMKASVRIPAADVDNVLLVPTSAVANGKAWVRKDGQETEREVTTGRTDGKMIEIVKGLKEGDEVLREAKK
jgi:multidrug resistance efflux pump